jgi:hypothetical protein
VLPIEESEVAVIALVHYFLFHGLSEVFCVRLLHSLVIIKYARVIGYPYIIKTPSATLILLCNMHS